MPASAGYHGASSLLSAHFNPADFSSRFFISAFPFCLSSPFDLPLFLFCPPILIPFLRKDKTLLNNVIQGPRILLQFVGAITKRRPSRPGIQHLDMIVSLNYKVYQHPWTGGHSGGGLKDRWMEKMCYGMGREIRGELSAILTKEPGSFRVALQHVFYRPAAIQSYRHGHKGGNYADMLPFWLANCRIKVIKAQRGRRDWTVHACYSSFSFRL